MYNRRSYAVRVVTLDEAVTVSWDTHTYSGWKNGKIIDNNGKIIDVKIVKRKYFKSRKNI